MPLTIFPPRLLQVPVICLIFHSSLIMMSRKQSAIKIKLFGHIGPDVRHELPLVKDQLGFHWDDRS